MRTTHEKFFSSLKQVEKRLKMEKGKLPSSAPSQCNCTSTGSAVSPLYLDFDSTNISCGSETPRAFLSNSSSTPSHNVSDQLHLVESECDEIEMMMGLLGLSGEKDEEVCCNSCNCEGGFYEKIVGVKGPKCGKEVERLNVWIDYYCKGEREERKEPLRLAHLLLGKASLVFGDDEPDLEFPSTLDEFLKNDPPL
ncbi:hypothetical protein QQ045_014405 [Rhodiola kirilowii]